MFSLRGEASHKRHRGKEMVKQLFRQSANTHGLMANIRISRLEEKLGSSPGKMVVMRKSCCHFYPENHQKYRPEHRSTKPAASKAAPQSLAHESRRFQIRTNYTKIVCTTIVYRANVKNITLSADEHLIEAARERAREEQSTLNEQFRLWLAQYTQRARRMDEYDATIASLRGKLHIGRKLTRDEMNAR